MVHGGCQWSTGAKGMGTGTGMGMAWALMYTPCVQALLGSFRLLGLLFNLTLEVSWIHLNPALNPKQQLETDKWSPKTTENGDYKENTVIFQ